MITLHQNSIATIQAAINTGMSNLYIYSGEIPEVNDSFTWTSAAFSAQQLTAAVTVSTGVLAGIIRFWPTPNPAAATKTGKATWFVLTQGATKQVLGTIGNQVVGTAPLILESTDLVTGQLVNFIQLGIRLI